MIYYEIKVTVPAQSLPAKDGSSEWSSDSTYRDFRKQAAAVETKLAKNAGDTWALAIIDQTDTTCNLVLVTAKPLDWEAVVRLFFAALAITPTAVVGTETTLRAVDNLLDENSSLHGFRLEDIDRWRHFGYRDVAFSLVNRSGFQPLSEHVVPAMTPQTAKQKAAALNLPSLEAELDRIAQTPVIADAAQPAEYLIEAADLTALKQLLTPLLAAKYAAGWLASRRYLLVENAELSPRAFSLPKWRHLFMETAGATLVIELNTVIHTITPELAQLLRLIEEYRNQVLVIFKLPVASRATQSELRRALPQVLFVDINLPALDRAAAQAYITRQVKIDHIAADASLKDAIAALKYPVAHQDLKQAYEQWHNRKLRQQNYPAYAALDTTAVVPAKDPAQRKSDAATQLANLIGLDEVKTLIAKVVSNFKIEKLRQARKLPVENASMHMVFTGNPGTAKTTVARLFAQILRDEGVLRVGDLIEVGSADIIGQFVGQTAPQVKSLFRRASGSVLFIDEAYSLAQQRGGYGQEAIDTIVQKMENHRDDVLVIFAGYPKEMNAFLDSNPGLRSRVAYQIPFPDYSIDELLAIAELQLAQLNLRLSRTAQKPLAAQLQAIKTRDPKNFGNGRTVRNVLEKALFNQGLRLSELPQLPTNAQLSELTAADFDLTLPDQAANHQVGFGAMLASH